MSYLLVHKESKLVLATSDTEPTYVKGEIILNGIHYPDLTLDNTEVVDTAVPVPSDWDRKKYKWEGGAHVQRPQWRDKNAPFPVKVKAGDTENVITWNPLGRKGDHTCNIYFSESAEVSKSDTKISDVESPHTHTGLVNGTEYFYVVTCTIDGVESDISVEKSGTPEV